MSETKVEIDIKRLEEIIKNSSIETLNKMYKELEEMENYLFSDSIKDIYIKIRTMLNEEYEKKQISRIENDEIYFNTTTHNNGDIELRFASIHKSFMLHRNCVTLKKEVALALAKHILETLGDER